MKNRFNQLLIILGAICLVSILFVPWLRYQRPDDQTEFIIHGGIYVVLCCLFSLLGMEVLLKKRGK